MQTRKGTSGEPPLESLVPESSVTLRSLLSKENSSPKTQEMPYGGFLSSHRQGGRGLKPPKLWPKMFQYRLKE